MFDDDTVLSQHDPPPKDWVVEAAGHLTDVEKFVESISHTFKDLKPEVAKILTDDEEDEVIVTIRMDWNSIGLERILVTMVPDHVRMRQWREDKQCQDKPT